jgi:dienelactone hydrolase
MTAGTGEMARRDRAIRTRGPGEPTHHGRVGRVILAAATALLAACSSDRPGIVAAGGSVEVATLALVDATRPTAATASSPGAPARTLETDVYVPAGAGPHPLVVLSHGLRSHPMRFARLLEALARAGYLAAAPAYPLTSSASPEGGDHAEDVFQQPDDLGFVIEEIVRLGDRRDGVLAGRVDGTRVGLIGSSLGAITSLGTAYNSCCRNPRVAAVLSISGLLFPFPGDFEIAPAPLLLIHGDADDVIPYSASEEAYARASAPKWLVTLLGGGHDVAQLGFDTEGAQERFDDFAAIVLDFLDLYLRAEPDALDRLVADASIEGVTTVRWELGPVPATR